MGFGTIYGKTSDVRLVSCYCSNTDEAALYPGRVVALRYTDTTWSGDGDVTPELGNGFGAAIDYTAATNSFVVGVLACQRYGETTFAHQSWAPVVTRGPIAEVTSTSTVAAAVAIFPDSGVDGHVNDETGDGTAPQGFVGYSITALNGGTSTGSISMFVNTLMA